MRIALIDTNPKQKLYSVALLKIGAWLKTRGDECDLFFDKLPGAGEYDEIWITTVFTFDIPHAMGIVREAITRAAVVKVGGVAATLFPKVFREAGAAVHVGLLKEAEAFNPDYSLLPDPPESSITHITRGCVRKCEFCMVPRIEKKYQERQGWENDIHPASKRILFYDNNWLARPLAKLAADVKKILNIMETTAVREVDFNQGLDCRLLTEKKADIIAQIPIIPLRFAFDGMQEDGYFQKAIRMMAARGLKESRSYVLYNFHDTPEDLYYRLRECAKLGEELKAEVNAFLMRYQPIDEYDGKRGYIGEHWTAKQKSGIMLILGAQGPTGLVSRRTVAEFEYWFTDSPQSFKKLIGWKDLRTYLARKTGQERLARLAGAGVG